jgi:hypothetical protein
MAPGVRNSKRVRATTQLDVLPSKSEPRTSKRHLVQEHTTPSDDNAAIEECNGTISPDNTSEEGNEAATHDNASVEQYIELLMMTFHFLKASCLFVLYLRELFCCF